jgi:hypothetical protein
MALATPHLIPLCLARLTSLGLVLETLVCVEELFARGEYELRLTIHTLDKPVLVFHALLPWFDS